MDDREHRYLKVRRWVDRDLENYRPLSLYATFLPIILMSALNRALSHPWRIVGWSLAIGLSATWGAFVLWRFVRYYRAAMLESDRAYDQRIKYALPPEYRDTESAGEARRRRAREANRKG